MMQHQPNVKRVNERMSEHTGLIGSLSLLLIQTQTARWQAAAPKLLTGAHLYLDIAKSGCNFHNYSYGMGSNDILIFLFQYRSLHYFFIIT